MRVDRAVSTTYLKGIDSSHSPKQIDLGLAPLGFAELRPMYGIYKLEEDRLTYCWAGPFKDRPKEFSAAEGSGHTLVNLERFSTGEQDIEKFLAEAGVQFTKQEEVGWIESIELTPDHEPSEYFPTIANLTRLKSLTASNVDDGVMTWLRNHEQLASLNLQGDSLTDRGIEMLVELPALRSLQIDSTSTSDAALASIARLPLTSLTLKNTRISIGELPQLGHLQLRLLQLFDRELTDQDFQTIVQAFPNLEQLKLDGCSFSQSALDSLDGLEKLQVLSLPQTTVNDEGMQSIARLQTLTNLYLDGTDITDESLALAANSLLNLQYFSVKENSKITDNGLENLLPASKLIYFWASPGTFSADTRKRFNDAPQKSRVYER